MNTKKSLGLLALAMMALVAMTPAASAEGDVNAPGIDVLNRALKTEVCVDPWTSDCGENKDSFATVEDTAIGCITSNPNHLTSKC